jgi:predicted phosphodiesterase
VSKIAIISDVHGDLVSLQQALKIIQKERCRKVICLGDVIDDKADNEKILSLLMQHETINIRGNHEDFEIVERTPLVQSYLDSCRDELTVGKFHFCHVIKRAPELTVKNNIEAWNIFDEFPWKCIFIGHNHLPAIFVRDENIIGECVQIEPAEGISFKINNGTRCIVSVGALAYGRDRFSRKSFVIFDSSNFSINYHFLQT